MGEQAKRIFLYAGVEKEKYELVKPDVAELNRVIIRGISGLMTILILLLLISTSFFDEVKTNRAVYGLGAMLAFLLFNISATFAKWNKKLIMPLLYLAYTVFYVYGILIDVFANPEQRAVTFMVMLVLLPILFTDRPYRTIAITLFYILVFIIGCIRHEANDVLINDIIYVIVFGALGLICGTMSSYFGVRRFVTERQLKETNVKLKNVSRIDQLTGMQNRNAYETDLYKIASSCKESLACIYLDVNGLKYYNDHEGHDKGDQMLKFVAEKIRENLGERFAYRIGGDEFVIFLPDPDDQEIRIATDRLLDILKPKGYYAAIGWKIHELEELSMNELIKEAEAFMYQKKVEFYKGSKFDRRQG